MSRKKTSLTNIYSTPKLKFFFLRQNNLILQTVKFIKLHNADVQNCKRNKTITYITYLYTLDTKEKTNVGNRKFIFIFK